MNPKTNLFTLVNPSTLLVLLPILCTGQMVNAELSLKIFTAPTVKQIYSLVWVVVLVVVFLRIWGNSYLHNVPIQRKQTPKRRCRFKPSDCIALIEVSLRGVAISLLGVFGILSLVCGVKTMATGTVVVVIGVCLVGVTGVFDWIKYKDKERELELKKRGDNQSK